MRIARKIGVLVAVPLIAVVAFAAVAVVSSGLEARNAERLRQLVVASSTAGQLAQELRVERTAAVMVLIYRSDRTETAFTEAAAVTDAAYQAFEDARTELTALPATTTALLDDIAVHHDNMVTLRNVVSSGEQTASAAAFSYRIVIADLLELRESVAQAGLAPVEVADQLEASAVLSQAIESSGLEQIAVVRSIDNGPLSSAAYGQITGHRRAYGDALADFTAHADPQWRHWLDTVQTSPDMVAATKLEARVAALDPGKSLDIDINDWNELMTTRAGQLQTVQRQVDDFIAEMVTDLRDAQRWTTGLESAAVIMVLVVALLLAYGMGRPVVNGLRRLRDAARHVVIADLPEAVHKLDNHEVLGELTPEQFADGMPPPVDVEGSDELAEVGEAFNAMHREAVRVAAQQALLRLHIGAIFVNLARRGHSLAGRLTAAIDEAERNELDPERLERLFALDHLVTLLSRSNDSLLVLGGTSPAKVRVADEPIADVLAAAQSQIEQYKRIQMSALDTDVAVRAGAVDDIVKLLAELMDNATRYSEPQVKVRARRLDDRLIIQIVDEGIGIDEVNLSIINARLASRPVLDLEAVRAMGLTVVGHIAARLGITVELRRGRTGTIAEVTVPGELVTDHDPTEQRTEPSARQRRPEPKAAPLFQVAGTSSSSSSSAASRGPGVPRAGRAEGTEIPVLEFDRRTVAGTDASGPASSAIPSRRKPAPHPIDTASVPAAPMFDDGWQAARDAAARHHDTDAGTGLPQRVPGDQLVPGGEPVAVSASDTSDYRDPAAVSATYAAYARGRSQGRLASLTPTDQPKAVQ